MSHLSLHTETSKICLSDTYDLHGKINNNVGKIHPFNIHLFTSPYLLNQFRNESILKRFRKRISNLMNNLLNYNGVGRTKGCFGESIIRCENVQT